MMLAKSFFRHRLQGQAPEVCGGGDACICCIWLGVVIVVVGCVGLVLVALKLTKRRCSDGDKQHQQQLYLHGVTSHWV